jgi:cephalosporin hydroxylase
MLAILDYAEAVAAGRSLDPLSGARRVVGIDIDVRSHNRAALDAHPMRHKLSLIEGSSIDPKVVAQVRSSIKPDDIVLVILDSNHTHEHVFSELKAYAPLTSPGSYCIVFDTIIEHLPPGSFPDRPWDIGDNPKTAVAEYLSGLAQREERDLNGRPLRFEVDTYIDSKLLISVAPSGYLRRALP